MAVRKLSTYSSGGETKSKLDDGSKVLLAMEEPTKRDSLIFDWNRQFKGPGIICGCFGTLLQLVLISAMVSLMFGYTLAVTNTMISHLAWEWKWCDYTTPGIEIIDCTRDTNYKSFISTAQYLGAAIGAAISGNFLVLGRRMLLIMSLVIYAFGAISSCCANSFTYLFWARLCGGFAIGVSSVAVPAYMSEICPPSVRGAYTVYHQTFINIGIFLSTAIGLPLGLVSAVPEGPGPHENIDVFAAVWWRVLFGFALVPTLLVFYLLMTVYTFETPHFYLERGHVADAEQCLRVILQKDDVREELKEISIEIEMAAQAKANGMSLGRALKRPDYRFVIIFGCVLSAFQQLSGINVAMTLSTSLFKSAGVSEEIAIVITVAMTLINVLATLVTIPIIERQGRKTLLVFGTVMETLVLLPAAICYWIDDDAVYTRWLAIVGSLLFVAAFGATYGPVLWVYLFEIFPLEIRGAAAGAGTAANWIASLAIVFIGAQITNQVAYTLFAAMAFIGALIVIFFMKETKGRVLGDSPYINRN